MKSSYICDTQPLSKIIKNQKLFRVGMFYVELNPGEDADEEDVISQSIKEIHQVLTLDQNSKILINNDRKTCFGSSSKIYPQSAQKLSDNIERLSNDQVMTENLYPPE